MLLTVIPLTLSFAIAAFAHSGHQKMEVPEDADWATRHMIEEHHIQFFDSDSFFSLHDFGSQNEWTPEDIMRIYGLLHETNQHVSQEAKDIAVKRILDLYDRDGSGTISQTEYTVGAGDGIKLPDLGYGPGHHGDDEYEYEIHHWELYHDENTKAEDLIHPEDIEHFRKHEEEDAAQREQELKNQMPIIEDNIPNKFWRG